jgi:erythromycin esterase-like protein
MCDGHMADTLDALVDHLGRRNGRRAKAVVWDHNSHVGDARATELGQAGEYSVGQLVRERHGHDDTLIVGFMTYTGTGTAAKRRTDRDPLARAGSTHASLNSEVLDVLAGGTRPE